jgi:GAF domain-containing protein
VLDVQSNRLNAFDQSDIVVLQSLADQAAIAIENARLFNAEQRRAEQFRVISEVGTHVASILTVEELLTQVARLIQEAFDYIRWRSASWRPQASCSGPGRAGPPSPDSRALACPLTKGSITGWVATTGQPLLVPDVSQEPRYVQMTATETRSELAVPMKVPGQGHWRN